MNKDSRRKGRLSLYQSHSLLRNVILERLADFERGDTGSGDGDLFLGSGVAADAGGALLDLEGAEADELDLLALGKSLSNGLENGVDSLLADLLGSADLLRNSGREFCFINVYSSCSMNGRESIGCGRSFVCRYSFDTADMLPYF